MSIWLAIGDLAAIGALPEVSSIAVTTIKHTQIAADVQLSDLRACASSQRTTRDKALEPNPNNPPPAFHTLPKGFGRLCPRPGAIGVAPCAVPDGVAGHSPSSHHGIASAVNIRDGRRSAYAFTVGTSAMLVVQAGDRICDRSFHSRLNPCDARECPMLVESGPSALRHWMR
jgi:hypothetical protein